MPDSILARIGRETKAALLADPMVQPVEVGGLEIFCRQEFMTPTECAKLVGMTQENLEPSGLMLAEGATNDGFRTSSSCNFDRLDPFINEIDTRIAKLLYMELSQGETIQGQRYGVGHVFKAHQDYFYPSESYWAEQQTQGGQRSWTAMVYLDEPGGGGETQFPSAGFKVSPRLGMLLAWNNMDENGDPNPMTLHESLPVLAGHKTIITKWFRRGDWWRG